MVAYGDPNGYSAMARTVGYTTAIVSHMLLNGLFFIILWVKKICIKWFAFIIIFGFFLVSYVTFLVF